ncbi:MBL fold metallo-hydrolase [Candidatus Dependentiae bacterium]|nr:MBL fold metallo-hydrolase [Candidatus Dependentiae bacterium]
MFSVFVLTSGSSGNSILLCDDESSILIDCGISGKELARRLDEIGESPDKIRGIIITHEHSDHVTGAGIVGRKYQIPIYIKSKTLCAVSDKFNKAQINIIEKHFNIERFEIECFPVSHDAADPIGLIVKKNNYKVGIVTDLGFVTGLVVNKLSGSDGIIIESNYDDKMLIHSERPLFLKQRIKSRFGHLSNDDAIRLVDNVDKSKLKFIMLYHISEEHNTYEIAFNRMKKYLETNNLNDIKLYACSQTQTCAYLR